MLTAHALDRVQGRLTAAGIDPKRVQLALSRYAPCVRRGCSVALRVLVLPTMVGEPWSDASNGDALWAIIRDGRVTTVMFRRTTQPCTPEAFRVDRVVTL